MSKSKKVEDELLELRLKEELLKNVAMHKLHEILDHDKPLSYIQ